MRCLIVSKTEAGREVCVGALAVNGTNVRLTEHLGSHFLPADTPYEIGQVWELSYTPRNDTVPPHGEDVLVTSREFSRTVPNLTQLLTGLVNPWRGGVASLFNGKIEGPTSSGSLYVQNDVPDQSVGFWLPDKDMLGAYTPGMSGFYYRYEPFRIPYVGVAHPPPDRIAAGTSVRVSLARWSKPRDAAPDFPERCYLQVSGSY